MSEVAAGLWGLGIRPGDRVGMWASSCVEWVYLQVATAKIGAVLVNVNPAYRTRDLAYILERSGIKAIFLHEQDARVNYAELLEEAKGRGNHSLRAFSAARHVAVGPHDRRRSRPRYRT